MANVKNYTLEVCKPCYADLSEHNERIVETAGFIPLDVKLKRFEQAGIAAQYHTSEFTSNDFRNLYANPDFELYPDDELEEVQEKLKAYNAYRNAYIKSLKAGDLAEGKSPAEQAERASEENRSQKRKLIASKTEPGRT